MSRNPARLLAPLLLAALPAAAGAQAPLHLAVFVADSASFHVTSTLITGPTEALLVDAQFRGGEVARLADQVQATGRRLTGIFITHPDDDHYLGLAVLHQRFPAAPIYMAPAALAEFRRTSARYIAAQRTKAPADIPDSFPAPQALPTTHLTVDGTAVEVVPDLQGDAFVPSNSFLWIPSLRAVVAGDIVFNGVHPWTANSTPRTRAAWQRSLGRIAALHPRTVIAGHKADATTPDTPDAVALLRAYLKDFDATAATSVSADGFVAAMTRRYPALGLPLFLSYGSRVAVPN